MGAAHPVKNVMFFACCLGSSQSQKKKIVDVRVDG
jgi:hypothetical protein